MALIVRPPRDDVELVGLPGDRGSRRPALRRDRPPRDRRRTARRPRHAPGPPGARHDLGGGRRPGGRGLRDGLRRRRGGPPRPGERPARARPARRGHCAAGTGQGLGGGARLPRHDPHHVPRRGLERAVLRQAGLRAAGRDRPRARAPGDPRPGDEPTVSTCSPARPCAASSTGRAAQRAAGRPKNASWSAATRSRPKRSGGRRARALASSSSWARSRRAGAGRRVPARRRGTARRPRWTRRGPARSPRPG